MLQGMWYESKLEKSSHPLKEAMILCLMELIGYEVQETTTEEWMDAIDRGGLWHKNDDAYQYFYLVEIEIRQYCIRNSNHELWLQ